MDEHLGYVSADVRLIYSRIGDNISRKIFENRLMMLLLQNKKSDDEMSILRKERDNDERLMKIFDEIKRFDGDILIYGAGECGRYICNSRYMDEIPVSGFIDNREWNKGKIFDLPVYEFEDAIKKYGKATIILSMESCVSRLRIKEQIAKRKDWKIIDVGEILREIDKETLLKVDNPYYKYIYDLVDTDVLASKLLCNIIRTDRLKVCWITFGEGDEIGRLIREKTGYYPWCCYIVSNKNRKEYNGIPVYTYEEAVNFYEQFDVIVESVQEGEIAKKAIMSSRKMGDYIDLNEVTEILGKKQYFDFFEYTDKKETFVDGGVYDWGSTKGFIEWCGENYDKILAFEPEKTNYEFCKEKMGDYDNVCLYNCGLFDRQGKVGFASGFGGASRIENQKQDFYADYEIEVNDLDSIVKGEKVTFIKMDIEGAEEKALLGARHTIMEQKPKLAICIYHKPEDIIELPALVLKMRPDYKIAFRHYSLRDTETVMYAW